jgi:putative ABC transport system permease protein
MAVYTTEKRLKEISIRKVLGASERKLIFLLSKGFLSLLILAAFIAIPATWIFFEKVVLVKFAYHQPIGLIEIFSGLFIVMGLAILMVTSQTFKAARSNPANVLKQE